jgi:sugar lactone lactonase YvrE
MKRLYTLLVCLSLPELLTAQEAPGTITTFAGLRSGTPSSQPKTVGIDVKENIYICIGGVMYRWGLDGVRTTVIGGSVIGGQANYGDGVPASQSLLRSAGNLPAGMVLDNRGHLYIADPGFDRVRRVDPNGYIWTFAGPKDVVFTSSLPPGEFSGDGDKAMLARLNRPTDVAIDAKGNIYIADSGNGRIRKVDLDGYIFTIAGNGGGVSSPVGDGGPATQATLVSPISVAVDTKGNIYIADYDAHRIRRVTPDLIITTFAGTGRAGFSGDGGPATQAQLNSPMGVAVDGAGNVYIADRQNHRVRRVGSDGIITTFAGTGRSGYSGDGGPATQADLDPPSDLVVDTKGYVYITFMDNFEYVRRVSPLKPLEVPSIHLSVSSMPFDATNLGSTSEQTFMISNTGKAPLSVTRIGVEGKNFSEFKVSPTSATVDTGASLTVTVRFTPASGGLKSASVSIEHNATGSPSVISLTGRGPERSRDFDGNGRVDFDDFFLFAAAFGQPVTGSTERYDLDFNGKIDFDDFFLFAERFGR